MLKPPTVEAVRTLSGEIRFLNSAVRQLAEIDDTFADYPNEHLAKADRLLNDWLQEAPGLPDAMSGAGRVGAGLIERDNLGQQVHCPQGLRHGAQFAALRQCPVQEVVEQGAQALGGLAHAPAQAQQAHRVLPLTVGRQQIG